jgi:hypothetical protein
MKPMESTPPDGFFDGASQFGICGCGAVLHIG